jgi:two-component system cell cycle sensor histidine kinase/response regulator CckA
MSAERTAGSGPLRGLGRALLTAADRAGLGVMVWLDRAQQQSVYHINAVAAELLGQSLGDTTELTLATTVDPRDLPKLRTAGDALEHEPRALDVRLLRGDAGPVSARIAVRHGRVGDEEASVGVVFDTAERHRAEQALQTSELLYRRVIDAAPEPILIVGGGQLLYANSAALRLSGFDRLEQMREAELSAEAHPAGLSWALERSHRSQEAGVERAVELRLQRPNGDCVHVEVVSMSTEWDGKPAVLHIGRELTARRQIQAQLIQADRLTAVGTLAAGVAHEINNPLAYVLLNLQYLLRELPKLDAQGSRLGQLLDRLREAQHGAERVKSIVRDLRQFSSADEQEQLGPVDLRRVLAAAIKVAKTQILSRARLIEDYQEIPAVEANAAKLEQVFLNLLINAAQSLPPGHPELSEIRVSALCAGPERVVVEVADTGTGIPPELLDRVFDPFFTTKPAGVGTGLGLPICHNIISSLGGEISVESELGRGTVFRVALRPWQQPPQQPRRPTPQPWPALTGAELPRARVLIVDDELAVASMLSRVLAEEHDVEVRTDGHEALQLLLGEQQFDMVMCDLLMPGMSGMDLYKELQARRPGMEQRMVFMTGGAFTPRASEFLSRVDNPRIEKPFDLHSVRRLVRELARGGGGQGKP